MFSYKNKKMLPSQKNNHYDDDFKKISVCVSSLINGMAIKIYHLSTVDKKN